MMDSKVSEKIPPRQLRSLIWQLLSASAQAVNYEPTPRGPLKRAKKPSKAQCETPAVNGTNDKGSDDEESPKKKSCLKGGDGHGPPKDEPEPMETQDKGEGQEDAKGPIKSLQLPQNPSIPGSLGDVHLKPYVVLGQRCSLRHSESESVIKTQVEQPKKRDASPSKHTTPTAPSNRTYDAHHVKVTSMADDKRTMETKITEIPKVNHYVPRKHPMSVTTTTRRRTTDSSAQKTGVAEKRQETNKTTVSHQRAGASSKDFLRFFCQLVLLMLLSVGLVLAFKHLPTLQRTKDVGSAHSSRSEISGLFVEELFLRFPSQRPELWKKTKIYLQKHLDLPHPTAPVSMILTAGVRAQKTLRCLAHNIAMAFSTALNASVVVTDGASRSNLDSDQVKMDIDNQLKAAFGGDKLAAVVHRFDELPPGSMLIFYRYKWAFILFTVLLSEEDLSTQQSLTEVEEMVQDHLKARSVGNKMDADQFNQLWCRIAHLILPVMYEDEIEQKGC